MFQLLAGIAYQIAHFLAAFGGLGAIGLCLIGIVDQSMFELGLLLGLIAVVLAVVARSLRCFEL